MSHQCLFFSALEIIEIISAMGTIFRNKKTRNYQKYSRTLMHTSITNIIVPGAYVERSSTADSLESTKTQLT